VLVASSNNIEFILTDTQEFPDAKVKISDVVVWIKQDV
jgi:hypothetical protein